MRQRKKTNAGYTIVELLVVIGIIVILSTVVIFKSTGFNDTTVLSNLTHDIALTIRQAQNYSTNVRESTFGGGSTYNTGYGLELTPGSPSSFFIFSDSQISGTPFIYDSSVDSQASVYRLDNGYTIQRICASNGSADDVCLSNDQFVNISYLRPDPEATITFLNNSHNAISGWNYNSVRVYIQSPSGNQRRVDVWVTGQISVQ